MPGPRAQTPPRLGLRENWQQFSLLVAVNAFVGAMVGIERSVIPLLARRTFGIASATALLSFIIAFGITKAITNLFAGTLAERFGRKRVLVLGWLIGLPVPLMIIWAPSWSWVVAANVLLGANQGLAWSMTVVMKIDLAGPKRRGLALGLNEAAGYVAVAVAAFVAGSLAAVHGPRPVPFLLGAGIAIAGLAVSVIFVHETIAHVRVESQTTDTIPARMLAHVSWVDPNLSAAAQAGFVNNLNDALAWGLLPVVLASRGLSTAAIAAVAAVYPLAWGLGQLYTGALSDRIGRRLLIIAGMWLQAAGIAMMLVPSGYWIWLLASLAMGLGTAMVYPTLLAVIGDVAAPAWRANAIGIYRFWRDGGYPAGALLAGLLTDAAGSSVAIGCVAGLTAISGVVVSRRMRETLRSP